MKVVLVVAGLVTALIFGFVGYQILNPEPSWEETLGCQETFLTSIQQLYVKDVFACRLPNEIAVVATFNHPGAKSEWISETEYFGYEVFEQGKLWAAVRDIYPEGILWEDVLAS